MRRSLLIALLLAAGFAAPAHAQYYSCGWVPVGVNAWGGTHYEWSCNHYYQYGVQYGQYGVTYPAYQTPYYYCPGTVWVETAPVQCCYGYTYWQGW